MKRGCQAKRTKDEHPSSRLVKIELDAAEALAEFSHIAHLPRQDKSGVNSHDSLQWSGKRKRSVRVGNSQAGPGCLEEGEATFMSSKAPKFTFYESKVFYATKRSFPIEERDEFSKACDSRAESPSPPLPSLQVDHKTFLLGASSAKSAFQRVPPMIPLQIPCHPPINIKIEDGCTDVNPAPTSQLHRVAIKKNPRIRRPPVLAVKLKQLGEQEASMKEPKDTGHQSLITEGLELKPSVNSALEMIEGNRQAGLRVVSKPKAALTVMEKEARRLRRVQANRESARQTIRRKQILCEELTKRAACLALENESMKQKKDLLMQELCSLKNRNRHLKQQLTIEPSCRESFQESSTMPLQTAIPASQVPSLPTSGIPVPSFAWDVSVTVVDTGNQTPLLHSDIIMSGVDSTVKGTTNDTSQSFGGNRQHQSSVYMPSQSSDTCITNQVCTSDVAQQTTTCNSKDSCPLRTSAQKEMGSVAAEREPPVKIETLHYDPYSAIKNPEGASENVINSIVCGDAVCQPSAHARSSSSPQLAAGFPALSCTSNNDAPGTSMATSRRLNYCFNGVPAQLSWAFNSYGGSLQTCVFIARETSAAAVAAAEARRRRKELTRSKILHSRTFRLLC